MAARRLNEKSLTYSERQKRAAFEAERRRSRRWLIAIIVASFIVPVAATVLMIGSEHLHIYAFVALALLVVGLGFAALFQRRIPKSQSSWPDPPPERLRGW